MSIKMLSKMLRADTQVAASLISSMSEMLPPAAGVGEVGGMLDVRG
jgi:hypothetical protein